MDVNIRSVWHGGGTRAPSSRAIDFASDPAKDQVESRFEGFARASGTEWHDGPRESIRGTWRAR